METNVLATLLLGFALGLRHSIDADHLTAVGTLVSESTDARHGVRVGAWWGLGHLLAILALGGAVAAFGLELNARVEWALEIGVACVLMALGARTIHRCFTGRYHFHVHGHGGREHAHLHFHPMTDTAHEHDSHAGATLHRAERSRGARPLLVGMAHGLAGTAGLALVVLGTIPAGALRIGFLAVFGAGALAGMVAFSAVLGVPFRRAAGRLQWLFGLRLAAGSVSAGLGVFLAVRAFLPGSLPF